MRQSLIAWAGLLATAPQTTALPIDEPLTLDVVNTTESSNLSKRDWYWPSIPCIACVSTGMAAGRPETETRWWYDPTIRLPRDMITPFAVASIACINRGYCFASTGAGIDPQTFTWRDGSPSEAGEMLLTLLDNGLVDLP